MVGLNSAEYPWLGGQRDPLNLTNWVWSDGTAWDYTNWLTGQPDNWNNNERCAHMSTSHKWNDFACSDQRTFVCKQTFGFIIAGGYSGSTLSSSEVFNPSTGTSCAVGNLPQTRQDTSMCNNMICGGYGSPEPDRTCELFDGVSSFTRLNVTLVERRDDLPCWGLKSGEVILFGGSNSKRTTERVSADGKSSSADFSLEDDT